MEIELREMIEKIKKYSENPEKLTKYFVPNYGWHNSLYPPEYRKECLKKTDIVPDKYMAVYYLMAAWYEKLCHVRAPVNFHVYRDWENRIRSLNANLITEEKEKLILVIYMGTWFYPEKRNIGKILELLEEMSAHESVRRANDSPGKI